MILACCVVQSSGLSSFHVVFFLTENVLGFFFCFNLLFHPHCYCTDTLDHAVKKNKRVLFGCESTNESTERPFNSCVPVSVERLDKDKDADVDADKIRTVRPVKSGPSTQLVEKIDEMRSRTSSRFPRSDSEGHPTDSKSGSSIRREACTELDTRRPAVVEQVQPEM